MNRLPRKTKKLTKSIYKNRYRVGWLKCENALNWYNFLIKKHMKYLSLYTAPALENSLNIFDNF